MKKTYIGYSVLAAVLALSAQQANAQQGFGTDKPSKASVVEMTSGSKGLLIPRVALTSLDSFAPVSGEAPTDVDKTDALLVYNTATSDAAVADEEKVTPGYYYWTTDGTSGKWNRIATGADAKAEPWFDQATNTEATDNEQNIYQMGSVAIAKNTAASGVSLDVAGAVRAGSGHIGTVGSNSIAFGQENTASANISFAIGYKNTASGLTSVALGNGSTASGGVSLSTGYLSEAIGNVSTAMGWNTIAPSNSETVIGKWNAINTGNAIENDIPTDGIFQIGVGTADNARRNAVTVLKNGNTGIGIAGTEAAAKPTERLDIGSGNVRVREINTVAGTITDKIVVADADGVLKPVEASTLSADAVEPWFVQGTTDQAEDNDDDIYIMGSVAIGTDETDKTLEVVGDFKAQVTDGDIIYGTEVNSPLNPASGMHYWMDGATGNYRVVTAHAGAAGMEAKTGAATVGFAAEATQASMNAKQDDNSAYSMIRTLNTGNFFMETYNVADNYGSTFSLQNDALRLVHSETDGLSNIIADENRSEILLQKENGVRFNFRDEDGDIKGEYWFPTEQGNEGEVLTRVGGNQTDWVSTRDMVAMPKFFYMPSIIVPTSNAQLAAPGSGATGGDSFNDVTRQGTIDLHARYTAQFGTPMVTNTTQTTTLPTLAAGALDYNITWYDINVFSAVSVNNLGVMTYTVAPGADITVGSFMNIVFAVK